MIKNTNLDLNEEFLSQEYSRVKKLFNKSKHYSASGFSNNSKLADWWLKQIKIQNGNCIYCETSILKIAQLIKNGRLKSRKTRGVGNRGPNLELERIDPGKPYSPENCSLACYYCNNDKSYIYSAEEYKIYFGPARNKHFHSLQDENLK